MQFSHIAAALASIAAFSASNLTQASPESRSAEACAQAFAQGIAGSTNAPKYTVAFKNMAALSPTVAYFATSYSFDLEAVNPQNGAITVRAVCTTHKGSTDATLSEWSMTPDQGKHPSAF